MNNILKKSRRPDITFCNNGRILISARVTRILELKPGDAINIAFADGECLLFSVRCSDTPGRHVAQCKPTKKGCDNFFTNSTALARAVIAASDPFASRIALAAGEPFSLGGITHIPLITRNPL